MSTKFWFYLLSSFNILCAFSNSSAEINVDQPQAQNPRPVGNCGTTPAVGRIQQGARIVGGKEAIPHSYPWQVIIIINKGQHCGGSLISSEWVLTAAHCLLLKESVNVTLGAHDISKEETSQAVEFNDFIQPVCLPTGESDLDTGVPVTATGWGLTDDGHLSEVLKEVTVLTITNEACDDYYGRNFGEYDQITKDHICVDTSGAQGTCGGDSGGPLIYQTGRGWQIRGVVTIVGNPCTSGVPAVFTQVTHFLDWIEANSGVTSST